MQLSSTVCHIPYSERGLQSGHYIAYKHNDKGSFTLYDDASAPRTVSRRDAHKHFEKIGYLAFYKKIEERKPTDEDRFLFKTISTAL